MFPIIRTIQLTNMNANVSLLDKILFLLFTGSKIIIMLSIIVSEKVMSTVSVQPPYIVTFHRLKTLPRLFSLTTMFHKRNLCRVFNIKP